jgi:hypothetical protein
MEPMDASENRQIARDSLFVLADLRLDGSAQEHRIKVRNLSDGGMMGEGAVRVVRGSGVEVSIRNIGWVKGTVAWVQDSRFGVAFNDPIDPRLARMRAASEEEAPHFTRAPQQAAAGAFRKI